MVGGALERKYLCSPVAEKKVAVQYPGNRKDYTALPIGDSVWGICLLLPPNDDRLRQERPETVPGPMK